MLGQRQLISAIVLGLTGWLPSASVALAASEPKNSATPAASAEAGPNKDGAQATKATPPRKEYKPPFPNRVNFFEPPEGVAEQVNSNAQQNSNSRQNVVLKGFVSLDNEPVQAVLLFNDKIVRLAAGDAANGLRIMSMSPPVIVVKTSDEQPLTLNLMKQLDPRTRSTKRSLVTLGSGHSTATHSAGSHGGLGLGQP